MDTFALVSPRISSRLLYGRLAIRSPLHYDHFSFTITLYVCSDHITLLSPQLSVSYTLRSPSPYGHFALQSTHFTFISLYGHLT